MRSGSKAILLTLGLTAGLLRSEPSPATVLTATLCTVQVVGAGCPIGDRLGPNEIFTNNVGVLGSNRWAILPFAVVDGTATAAGNIFVADIAGKYIYLFGDGVTTDNTGGLLGTSYFNLGITQIYRTFGATGPFGGFDIGFCDAAATPGSRNRGFFSVSGVGLTADAGNSTACSPFAEKFGPNVVHEGAITTSMRAVDSSIYKPGVNGQAMTLPWGDDFPDPLAFALNNDILSDASVATIEADFANLGLTQQVPEPSTLLLLGGGLIGIGGWRRRSQNKPHQC